MDKQTDIIHQATKLSLESRKVIANAIIQSIDRDETKVSAAQRFLQLVEIAEPIVGISYNRRSKANGDSYIRSIAAKAMYDEGYNHTCIGKAMGRHRSSVYVMLQKANDIAFGFYGKDWQEKYYEFFNKL